MTKENNDLAYSSFTITDFEEIKQKVLSWVQSFSTFCFLDNHQYQFEPHSVECLLAAGVKRGLKVNAGNALVELQELIDEKNSWLFGHLAYDLKNEIEGLSSAHADKVQFPDLYFFEPEILIRITEKALLIEAEDPSGVYDAILQQQVGQKKAGKQFISIQHRFSREQYIDIIRQLRQHILRGDCYEINFCQEFFATTSIDPVTVYRRLSDISPNPFSALYRLNDQWLICASPERFLKKDGRHIISQPIKGTSKRMVGDEVADQQNKTSLSNSAKDRSENVMVVDLVRNDLARICTEGSVRVDELYGIYSFPQVHQMISTISGELSTGTNFTGIIKACFPMGSMTGAPKRMVMQLIERYEAVKRGIFSGAVGYINPDGDFDFNVVIRSIMYNDANNYLSFQAGSGITFYSEPEQEWEECMMKAEAMKKVLE